MIELLKADISKYTADAAHLAKEIAIHEEDIATWEGDIKAATKVREIEKALYDKTHKDYSESIDALGRAIATLKKESHDRAQALIQVSSLKARGIFDDATQQEMSSLLSTDEDSAEEQPA